MHRWCTCPVMLNALSKSFTCSLILILILILILVCDPVDLNTVMRNSEDHDVPSDTRAAIVAAFYLGFQPINLASVKGSRATRAGAQLDRPLKWGDLRVLDIKGQRAYEVTVREQAATTHSGDYAPKPTLQQAWAAAREEPSTISRRPALDRSDPTWANSTIP